jgi:hypothetical protein
MNENGESTGRQRDDEDDYDDVVHDNVGSTTATPGYGNDAQDLTVR